MSLFNPFFAIQSSRRGVYTIAAAAVLFLRFQDFAFFVSEKLKRTGRSQVGSSDPPTGVPICPARILDEEE